MKKNNNNIENMFTIKETTVIIILVCAISVLATFLILDRNYTSSTGVSYAKLLNDKSVREFLDVYASITQNYYEDVDANDVVTHGIESMMDYLGDKYTVYLNSTDADALTDSLSGKYEGIGITLTDLQPGIIQSVLDDSPAQKAGLQEGDIIISINGEELIEKPNSQITNIIKNSKDKKINMKIKRNEEELEINLELKVITSVNTSYKVITENEKNIGYLYIDSFTQTLPEQIEKNLNKLENENIESLIIDVRGNGGGYLSSAESVASLFLEKGKKIYSLKTKEEVRDFYDETDTKRDYPILILIDGATASASEILASALIDSYGAKTLGNVSYGKGKVQQAKTLDDGSIVKYTTSYWLRPNGECIDEIGIQPDYGIELEYIRDENDVVVDIIDKQLEKAIEILSE